MAPRGVSKQNSVQIKDVAKHAGVSTATVSRVINGASVKPDLRIAVERSVKKLGYEPNRQARSLRKQRSELIALIVPDIENPFFNALARGVEDVTQAVGFSIVLCNSDEDSKKEDKYLTIAKSTGMAGVIIAPATTSPRIDQLISEGRAVVTIDRTVTCHVDSVTFDNFALGASGASDLIERGYERIACITGPSTASTANDRADGWASELRKKGLTIKGLLKTANFRVDGGRAAAQELMAMDNPPDAILATNNLVGVGVLQALDQLNKTKVGVTVIGDVPFASASSENAHTIPLDPRSIGEQAARMLLERINGLKVPPRKVVQGVTGPRLLSWD